MEILECTVGAVDASTMRVAAAFARPAAPATRTHLLLPDARTRSMAGVGRYAVQGTDMGWDGAWVGSKNVAKGIDLTTSFPTRLGQPPDDPPVI